MKNKAYGRLPGDRCCNVYHWRLRTKSRTGSRSGSEGIARHQTHGNFNAWSSHRQTRCQFRKKEPRGIRTIALLSVFSKWFTTVRVDLLHVGKEPIEGWKGVNCKHVQALLTKILQRRWSGRQTAAGPIWNRDSPDTRRPSWQAWTKKTAFDVAKPTVVSKILSLTGVHGQWRRLYWQKCRTCRDRLVLRIARRTFDTRTASATAGWRPQCCGGRVGKYVLRNAEKKWKARGCGLTFRVCAQEHDVGGQIWAIQRPREE